MVVPDAVTVHEPGEEGAVNSPDLLIVPQVVVQVTLALAENCSVAFVGTVGLIGAIESGSRALPDPDSATGCGLPLAESEIVSVAVRDPAALGLKTIPMLQLPDPWRLEPHVLLVIEKSPGSVPAIATLLIETVVVPSL